MVKAEGKLLSIDSNIKEDQKVVEILERYSGPFSEVVCTSKVLLANPDEGYSPLGNLAAEALRVIIETDVALLDRGAVRGEIKPGKVTVSEVCQIHLWRNRVLELILTGEQLKRIVEEQDIHTAGLSYSEIGDKIRDLKVGKLPIDLDKRYKVAAGEFLLAFVPTLRDISYKVTGERVDTVLFKYFEQIQVIDEEAYGKN